MLLRSAFKHRPAANGWACRAGLLALLVNACSPVNSSAEAAADASAVELSDTDDTTSEAPSPSSAASSPASASAAPSAESTDDEATDGEDVVFGGGMATVAVGTDPEGMPDDPAGDDGQPEDPDEPPNVIVACDVAVGLGEQPMIDDFEDQDLDILESDGRAASWYSYNSEGDDSAQVLEVVSGVESPAGGQSVLHTAGSGFEWAGVGFGLRWGITNEQDEWIECTYNASAYTGIQFWARGSGEVRLSATVPEVIPIDDGGSCDEVNGSCWNSHGVYLEFTDEWQLYVIPFSEMLQDEDTLGPLDPSRIRTMEFQTGSQAVFEFWVDAMSFIADGASGDDDSTSDDGAGGSGGAGDDLADDAASDDLADDSEPNEPTDATNVLDAGSESASDTDASVQMSSDGGT